MGEQRSLFGDIDTRGKDPTAGFHGGNEQSKESWDSLQSEELSRMRRYLLLLVRAAGKKGMTCDELEVETQLSHQTVSARCTELKKRGFISVAGKRPTRTGRNAAVYVAS